MAANFSHSSKQEVPRAHKNEDEHEEREENTANNLLALKLHW
jgi:hypothetical protein